MAYFPREGCCVLFFGFFFPVRLFLTFLLIALQPIFLEMGQNMCVTGCLFFQHWQLCVSWRQKCLCSEEMLCPFGGNTTRFQQELEFTNGNWCNLIQTLLSFLFAQQCCAYEHAGLPKLVRTNIVLKTAISSNRLAASTALQGCSSHWKKGCLLLYVSCELRFSSPQGKGLCPQSSQVPSLLCSSCLAASLFPRFCHFLFFFFSMQSFSIHCRMDCVVHQQPLSLPK